MSRRRARGEAGETLAEIIVTIGIIGLAVVALVGALATGISASAGHRQHASADTIARSVAEAVKDRNVELVANGSYPSSIWSGTVDATGFDVTVTGRCLEDDAEFPESLSETDFEEDCSDSSPGVQLITVTVTSKGSKGEQQSVSIMKVADFK